MTSRDLLQMAIKNLLRRKLRTSLTILGVVIGTAAIVLMLSLGIGMNAAIKQSIMQMGSINIVTVYSGGGYMGPSGKGVSSGDARLDINAVSTFQSIPGVEAVTPIMQNYWKIIGRKYAAEVQVVGIDPEAMQKMDYNLAEGRLLQPGDGLSMVFGSEIINMFHDRRSNGNYRMGPGMGTNGPDIDLLKEKFVITYDTAYGQRRSFYDTADDRDPAETYDIQGVGILEPGNWENAYSIFIPIDQMEDIQEDQQKWERSGDGSNTRYERTQNEYQQVKVKVKDLNDVQTVQEAIMNMGYQAQSLNDILESSKKTMAVTQAILGGIGAVSLLVAAIGITNTMVMAIYERTREIGIMKVIGATIADIRKMFLLEAALIGLGGGLLGLALSYLGSWIINMVTRQFSAGMGMGPGDTVTNISLVPWWLALLALVFTSLVGVVAGYFPARRATQLSALEAIRTF